MTGSATGRLRRSFVPLDGLTGSVRPEHLHAALSRWFDNGDEHHQRIKPYTISPVTQRDGQFGVEIATLTDAAFERLTTTTSGRPTLRLGATPATVHPAEPVFEVSWHDLQQPGGKHWRVEFLTPTTFRTRDATSPFPTPSVVLRSPTECWASFSGLPPRSLAATKAAEVRVSELDLRSLVVEVNRRPVTAVLGHITFSPGTLAAEIGPLFRLASFSGVGAIRGKGLGVVEVTES